MYRMAPARQPLPGTELVTRIADDGLGAYVGTPTYFATPAGAAGIRGLGCGCGGSRCGRGCNCGVGYFDSGLDVSGWGWAEWLTVVGGVYVLASTVFTTSRGVRAVGRMPANRRKRKAAALRARASELSKKK